MGETSVVFRNETTFNGYPFSTAKSALQKYIRRGEVKKAIYFAIELDLFKDVEGGKRCHTNFRHRLQIILLEDIGLANPDLLLRFEKLDIPQLVYLMASSNHSRFILCTGGRRGKPHHLTKSLKFLFWISFPLTVRKSLTLLDG